MPMLVAHGVVNHNELSRIVVPILLLGTAILLLNAVNTTIDTLNDAELQKYIRALALQKINKTLKTDYENLESSHCRHLFQRASQALWMMGADSTLTSFHKSFVGLITDILGLLLFGAVISMLNPLIAVVLIIAQTLNFFIIKSIQNKQYLSREHTEPLDRKLWYIANSSGDYKSGKDIRLYSLTHWLLTLYKDLTKERLAWDYKFAKKRFISSIFDGAIILLRDGVAYTLLIYMILNQRITIEYFILFFGAINGLSTWIGGILNKAININETSLVLCDLRDYLEYPERGSSSEAKHVSQISMSYIELSNVSYCFKDAVECTIKNISLKIEEKEKIAIVGPNGAGKTTLIKLICGLYNPTEGKIHIAGKEKNDYNIYDYYRLFSVVFQDFHLLPVSIASNISCSKKGTYDGAAIKESIFLAGLNTFLERCPDGYETLINKQINIDGIELSGGEQQKLLLARAIYRNAPILVLDEPTSALDPIAENELYCKYNMLTQNKTSIFISHRLASTRFCDRILFFDGGRIVESGSHDELMALKGRYHELYSIQSQYYQEGCDF